jgi:hypothetical protein
MYPIANLSPGLAHSLLRRQRHKTAVYCTQAALEKVRTRIASRHALVIRRLLQLATQLETGSRPNVKVGNRPHGLLTKIKATPYIRENLNRFADYTKIK